MLRVCNTALSALTLLVAGHGSCKMALYIAAYGLTVKRVLASVSGLDGLRIRVRHPAAVPHCGVGARRGVSGCSAVCAVVCAAGGDGISTIMPAQAGTLDPDVMEQELRPLV